MIQSTNLSAEFNALKRPYEIQVSQPNTDGLVIDVITVDTTDQVQMIPSTGGRWKLFVNDAKAKRRYLIHLGMDDRIVAISRKAAPLGADKIRLDGAELFVCKNTETSIQPAPVDVTAPVDHNRFAERVRANDVDAFLFYSNKSQFSVVEVL